MSFFSKTFPYFFFFLSSAQQEQLEGQLAQSHEHPPPCLYFLISLINTTMKITATIAPTIIVGKFIFHSLFYPKETLCIFGFFELAIANHRIIYSKYHGLSTGISSFLDFYENQIKKQLFFFDLSYFLLA